MNEEIIQIAQRIKGLRDISGISLERFSKDLGIELDDLKLIESGMTDISLALLIKISNKFGIELAALLSGDNPKLHQYTVVRKNQGRSVERRKQYKYESLAFNFANKNAEPFIVTAEPDSENQDLQFNSHPGQEFNYVLEGSMTIYIEEHQILLNEGDSIYFNSGYKHAMKAMNNKEVKFLAVVL